MSLIHFSGFPYLFRWRKDMLPVLSSQCKAVLVKLIKAESETQDWLVWPTLQRGSPDAGRICRSRICHGLLLPSAALRIYWPSAKASLWVLWQLLGRCQPVTGHNTGPVLLGLYNKGLGTAEIFLKNSSGHWENHREGTNSSVLRSLPPAMLSSHEQRLDSRGPFSRFVFSVWGQGLYAY